MLMNGWMIVTYETVFIEALRYVLLGIDSKILLIVIFMTDGTSATLRKEVGVVVINAFRQT